MAAPGSRIFQGRGPERQDRIVLQEIETYWAGVEGRRSIVFNLSIADGETTCGSGTLVTLKLCGGRGKDAASTVSIGDLAVIDAVSTGGMSTTDAVLPVI